MRVTVTQMRDAAADFEQDWARLREHVQSQRSELVLLPEMPFHPWFAGSRQFKIKRLNFERCSDFVKNSSFDLHKLNLLG